MDTELDERKENIKSDHPDVSGNGRAGRLKNDFQIHGFEFKLRHNPE